MNVFKLSNIYQLWQAVFVLVSTQIMTLILISQMENKIRNLPECKALIIKVDK